VELTRQRNHAHDSNSRRVDRRSFALGVPRCAAGSAKDLIITGDHGTSGRKTTPYLKTCWRRRAERRRDRDPRKDLTRENLAKYDVLLTELQGHPAGRRTPPGRDANKKAFTDAVNGGKGWSFITTPRRRFISRDDRGQAVREDHRGLVAHAGFHGKRHEYDVTVK
jgi:hypothetical protein